MDRRNFMRQIKVLGAGVVLSRLQPPAALAARGEAWSRGDPATAQNAPPNVAALHASTLIVNGLDPSVLNERYLGMLKSAGVKCWQKSHDDVQSFANTYNFLDQHRDAIMACRTVKEIRQAAQQGKIALVFGWQSANPLGDAPGDPPPTALRAYYEMGLRVCGIAYNVANIFGGGSLEPQVGLTRAGRRLVEEIHKLGILLDVGGHTAEQVGFDAIAMSSGVPIVCTHTNVKALNDNARCMTDRLIEAIAKTGGVVGLTAFNDFHARTAKDAQVTRTPQVGLEKHLDQYDYIKKLVGVDHVVLGPDFVEGRNEAGPRSPTQPPEAYSEKPWFYVKGFENISELPNVTAGLLRRGWTEGDLRKMLGDNWLRVYAKVWDGATS